MRTIFKKTVVEVVRVKDKDMQSSILTLRWKNGIKDTIAAAYRSYEYESCPIYFLRQEMTKKQKFLLIGRFDEWYGNTSQETTEWALEFQVVVRMLLSGYLVVNPKYLEMEDVLEDILQILVKC